MNLRILAGVVLAVHLIDLSLCDKKTTDKTKRGIYDLGDGIAYNVLPLQHLATYTQVRAVSQDETPIVDLTYKPTDATLPTDNQYVNSYADTHRASNNGFGGPTYQPHQLQTYGSTTRNPQLLNFQNIQKEQLNAPQQHAPQHYPGNYHPKQSANIIYGTDKYHPSSTLRTTQEIKLPQYGATYSTIPVIYQQSQENVPLLKYLQNPTNGPNHQENLQLLKYLQHPTNGPHHQNAENVQLLKYLQHPTNTPNQHHNQLQTLHQPLQQFINPHQNKLAGKLHLNQNHQNGHLKNAHTSASPMSQISQNFKTIHPDFFTPQVFDNPVVPQIQHYLPKPQNPFDVFTRQIKPSPIYHEKPAAQEIQNKQPTKSTEPEKDEEVNRKTKEEIESEEVHEEENNEEKFEKGYEDSARGFPTTYHRDDDDDYRRGRYHDDDEDGEDSRGRYTNYKSQYRHHDDDDDDEYHREREYQRPHDYDDDTRGRYYSDHDHEGSQHHNKKESREKHRDHLPRPSKSHRNSQKHYKDDERDHPSSRRPAPSSSKYYKSSSSNSRKPPSDTRHASTSPKKSVKTTPRTKTTVRSEAELTAPKYQYGFEPIKAPYSQGSRGVNEDSEGRHSSPAAKKKVYRENWYVSKSSES